MPSSIGYFIHGTDDLKNQLNSLLEKKFNFIVTPLTTPRIKEFRPLCDLLLSSHDWQSYVAAFITTEEIYNVNQAEFTHIESQLSYCQHLSLRSVIIECPDNLNAATKLGRLLNSRMVDTENCASFKINIQVCVQSPRDQSSILLADPKPNDLIKSKPDARDPWKLFNQLRSHCIYERRLGVALELDGDLPEGEERKKWLGEPIRIIILPVSCFIFNKRDSLVISAPHQEFILQLIEKNARQIQFVVKGFLQPAQLSYVTQYLKHLQSQYMSPDPVSEFAKGYEDYLQIPLQPLADNLESSTYEIFERDPVKYKEYERAIFSALSTFPRDQQVIILLVGAGRGPLIRCAIKAATAIACSIHLYAVEKNPNAAFTLKYQNWFEPLPKEENKSVVEIITSDIRDWQAPKLADIVLSELLGSFADNELSPECLDGVWRNVKPNAISIPVSYRSFISPIMSHKLYAETVGARERDKPNYTALELGYVVFMKNYYEIDRPQQLFEFVHDDLTLHPNQRNNTRYASLSFYAQTDCLLHGFAGYFDTTLYGDIMLSTVPSSHSPGMFSWFPLWIPMASPTYIKKDQKITIHFWRLTSKRKVWYEWCLSEPICTTPQNPNGRSQSIGLL